MIKHRIKNLISEALKNNFGSQAPEDFSVSTPPAGIKGDYAVNLPVIYASKNRLPLKEAVEKILPVLENIKGLEDFSVAGGFVNFNVSGDFLCEFIFEIILSSGGEIYHIGENSLKIVLVEFVSSNPTGPLHIGHARCAAIGDSLARIYEILGYGRVEREYYVNDLGFQVRMLEDSVRARIRQIKGLPSDFPENGYKGLYIQDIAREAIERFGEEWEESDIGGFAVGKMMETTRRDLESFGVRMDNYFSESSLKSKTDELIKDFISRGIAYYDDGALWFGTSAGGDIGDDKDRVLKKRTGEYTYFATDIAYHKNKFERGYDEIINVWGADHHGYVPRIKAAVRAMGFDEAKLKIILYQLVSLRRGKEKIAMSTRAGEFVTLKEVIDEVGRDAARFFLLMRSPGSAIDFDLELAKKQSAENPVYYVQYAHARICSVFNLAKVKVTQMATTSVENFVLSGCSGERSGLMSEEDKKNLKMYLGILKEVPERELMKSVAALGDVLILSGKDLSAHHITVYLIDVAKRLHNFYEKCRVISPDDKNTTFARLALLGAARKVIKTALDVLGVSAPESM